MPKVFVYGTLLSGERNNLFLQNPEYKLLGNCKVTGFTMYNLGAFPACVRDYSFNTINGEVWEISDGRLDCLDGLEGYPNFYNREEIPTEFGYAWIYIHTKEPNAEVIKSGNWKQYIKKENN